MLSFLADLLLRMLGDNPIQYGEADKWPSVLAILSDFLVPQGQIILFVLPFVLIKIWRKKFTVQNVIAATVIGGCLALFLYVFDTWLLDWGQAQLFYDIHGIER